MVKAEVDVVGAAVNWRRRVDRNLGSGIGGGDGVGKIADLIVAIVRADIDR